MDKKFEFYVASCDAEGGIYRYSFENGTVQLREKIALDSPMYMAKSGERLYVLLRAPFEGSNESGLVTVENGIVSEPETTHGVVACHLCIDKGRVYCVNYLSGNVVLMPDKIDVHSGSSIHPKRQTVPHTHYVNVSPDGKYILAVDLGTDTIYTYDKELNKIAEARVPAGHGARHLAFGGDYVYCANELSSDISVFSYGDGRLTLVKNVPGLPADFAGENIMAAIRISGNCLFASNRGHDSIAVFRLNNGIPEIDGFYSCGGSSPRDFDIINNILICTNEASDNVTFYEVDGTRLTKLDAELKIKAPLCVIPC
ncbi:MAG: lactonase family protein [Clostridia bacterium]|nr:lactonase family protein [Clostridia bacterium]